MANAINLKSFAANSVYLATVAELQDTVEPKDPESGKRAKLEPDKYTAAVDRACKAIGIPEYYGSGIARVVRSQRKASARKVEYDRGYRAGQGAGKLAGVERGKGKGEMLALLALIDECQAKGTDSVSVKELRAKLAG